METNSQIDGERYYISPTSDEYIDLLLSEETDHIFARDDQGRLSLLIAHLPQDEDLKAMNTYKKTIKDDDAYIFACKVEFQHTKLLLFAEAMVHLARRVEAAIQKTLPGPVLEPFAATVAYSMIKAHQDMANSIYIVHEIAIHRKHLEMEQDELKKEKENLFKAQINFATKVTFFEETSKLYKDKVISLEKKLIDERKKFEESSKKTLDSIKIKHQKELNKKDKESNKIIDEISKNYKQKLDLIIAENIKLKIRNEKLQTEIKPNQKSKRKSKLNSKVSSPGVSIFRRWNSMRPIRKIETCLEIDPKIADLLDLAVESNRENMISMFI